MSYRPLTITSPLYRAWATMRLRSIEEWTVAWALPETFAGVNGAPYCGGVPEIAKFCDQIRRKVVYTLAAQAGMPANILAAYTAFLESLTLYNCLAGGVGTPHHRQCGIPQGCPFSIMMTAIIMRPWIKIMRTIIHVECFILADDVLIIHFIHDHPFRPSP